MHELREIFLQIAYMAEQQKRTLKFSRDKQIIFMESILQLIESDAFIADIAKHITAFGGKAEKEIGRSITRCINNNGTLSQGLKPYIDPMAYQAIAAGERTGHLSQGLRNAIDTIKMRKSMASDLVWALIKPLGSISAAFVASAAIAYWVFPILAKNMPQELWKPWPTNVYAFGNFWANHGLAIGISLIAIMVAAVISMPFLTGPVRKGLDNLPFFKQYRLVVIINTLRSLGYMTRAGQDISVAMKSLEDHSNQYLKSHLSIMRKRLSSEKNIGVIMDTGLLTKEWVGLMQMVGKSGHFDITLLRGATVTKGKLEKEIYQLSTYGAAAIKIVSLLIFSFVIGGTLMMVIDLVKVRPF